MKSGNKMKKITLFITILMLAGLVLVGGGCGKKPDGLSFETAIVIEADNSSEGLKAEYDWLYANACLDKEGILDRGMQELQENDGRKYDVMHMICNNGAEEIYYFQIDSFYGKW